MLDIMEQDLNNARQVVAYRQFKGVQTFVIAVVNGSGITLLVDITEGRRCFTRAQFKAYCEDTDVTDLGLILATEKLRVGRL